MTQNSVFGDIDDDFESMFAESVTAAEDEEGRLPEEQITQTHKPVVEEDNIVEEFYEDTGDVDVAQEDTHDEVQHVEEAVYDEPEVEPVTPQVRQQPVHEPEPQVEVQQPVSQSAPVQQQYEPEPVYETEQPQQYVDEGYDEVYEEEGSFDVNGSQAMNLKEGIDFDVSIETIEEVVKILDAYRSLEDDEREFAGRFMGLEVDTPESSVVSAVLNADQLLFEVFPALLEAKEQDDTEMAFYVVSRRRDVLEGMSFVAAQYLDDDPADNKAEKVSYAREIVTQIKQLDERALRLIRAANSLVHGEALTEDDEYRE